MKKLTARVLKLLLSWVEPKAEPAQVLYVSPFKRYDEMNAQERLRAQDKLDDMVAFAKYMMPDFQDRDADARSFFTSCFYNGWEAGFWDSYTQRDDAACYNTGTICFSSGYAAGQTRAMLWVPPAQKE